MPSWIVAEIRPGPETGSDKLLVSAYLKLCAKKERTHRSPPLSVFCFLLFAFCFLKTHILNWRVLLAVSTRVTAVVHVRVKLNQ
jgi:hypothetical protein